MSEISVQTDFAKLANFIAQKQAEGWVVTGVCMSSPEIHKGTGYAICETVIIDKGRWRWLRIPRAWRDFFAPRLRFR